MDDHPFADVGLAAQVQPAHAAGVVAMGEATFSVLATATRQPFAAFA